MLQEFLVRRREDLEGVAVGSRGPKVLTVPLGTPDRADLLAVVTAVQPATYGLAELDGNRPRGLHQPGQAPAGVDHPRGHDGSGRTTVQATLAGTTTIAHRLALRKRSIGDHRAEHEPTTPTRNKDVGVLTVPTDSRPDGGRSVDQGVVVGHHPSLPAVGLQAAGHPPKSFP